MKKRFALIVILCVATCCPSLCERLQAQEQTQKLKVSVLGDSYSTFEGMMNPSTNVNWYFKGHAQSKNDVKRVEETWWHQLIDSLDMQLEVNNSYSGSTICCTGYRGDDYSDRTFIGRMYNLGNPDIIFIFGATNDSWSNAPIGQYKYKKWTKQDLYSIRPAVAYLLSQMKMLYTDSKIYFLLNSELKGEVNETVLSLCKRYDIECIELHDIDKQSGHPSVAGMKMIAAQIAEYLK